MTIFIKQSLLALWLACLPCSSFAQKSTDYPAQPSAESETALRGAYAIYVQAVQSNRLSSMRTSQRLLLLSVSLSPQQWKTIGSSKGLGLNEVTEEQAPLFLSLIPEPFHTRPSTLKQGGRSVYGSVTKLSPQDRVGIRLRLDRAVEVTLLEEASPTSGRVFRNWGPEDEEATVIQVYAAASVENGQPIFALTGEQERLLHIRTAAAGRSFVHYAPEDMFVPAAWLDSKLETEWRKGPGPRTIDVNIRDLPRQQQMRIAERIAAWNEANPTLQLVGDHVKMRMEFRLLYLLPDGSHVLTPNT